MAQSYSITPKEVSSIWRLLLNTGEQDPDKLFSTERIEKTVNDLVSLGEIRKEVAGEAKAAAVLGGEIATGRSIGTEFTTDFPEQIDERYFRGSESELKAARTGQRGVEPTRRRLKPVEDIEGGMLKIIRKSFSTNHGRRFFRQVRNEYRRTQGQDPVSLKSIRNELRSQKSRETESPVVSEARKAARSAAGKEETAMGARPPSGRSVDIHRRNLGSLTAAELPAGIEFDPATDAERSIRRLRRLRGKPKNVPLEGARGATQVDDLSEEQRATDRAASIRRREVRLLNRILKTGRNPVTGERITESERQEILKNLQKPSGSLAKSIDVVGRKVGKIAGGFGKLMGLYTGFDPTIKTQPGDVGAGEQKPIMLRALSRMLAKVDPKTKAEVSKVARRRKAMEVLKERLRNRKPKKGDAPTIQISPQADEIVKPKLTERMAEQETSRRQDEYRKARREEAIRLLRGTRAEMSPRILDQPTNLPPGRSVGRISRAESDRNRRAAEARAAEAAMPAVQAEQAEALKELFRRLNLEGGMLDRSLRAAESVKRFRNRKPGGGAHAGAGLPPEFTDVPPEVLERAAARVKSGRGMKLATGRQAIQILRQLGKRKK